MSLHRWPVWLLSSLTLLAPSCVQSSEKKDKKRSAAPEGPQAEGQPRETLAGRPQLTIEDPLASLPKVGTWSPLSTTGAPKPCSYGTQVFWTGSQLLVFGEATGRADGVACAPKGALWDKATNAWKPMATDGGPGGDLDSTVERNAEVFFHGGILYVVMRQPEHSRAYDVAKNTWGPLPAGARAAVWKGAAPGAPDGEGDFRAYEIKGDQLVTAGDAGLRVVDLKTFAATDLPTEGQLPDKDPELGERYDTGVVMADGQLLQFARYAKESGEPATVRLALAPLDGKGPFKPVAIPPMSPEASTQCSELVETATSAVSSAFILVREDQEDSKGESSFYCLTSVDPKSGAALKTARVMKSRSVEKEGTGSEFLNYRLATRAASKEHLVFRLYRDEGQEQIQGEEIKSRTYNGYDERLLVFQVAQGTAALTAPLPGSAERKEMFLVATDKGVIAWGGFKGTDEGEGLSETTNEGMILEWP